MFCGLGNHCLMLNKNQFSRISSTLFVIAAKTHFFSCFAGIITLTKFDQINLFHKQALEVFCEKGLLRKHLWWSLSLIKLTTWETATLLKRDSDMGVFLWNFWNFYIVCRGVPSPTWKTSPPKEPIPTWNDIT